MSNIASTAGVTVEGTLSINIVEVAYEYDLSRSPDTDLSLSTGRYEDHLLNYRGALIWQPGWFGVGYDYS